MVNLEGFSKRFLLVPPLKRIKRRYLIFLEIPSKPSRLKSNLAPPQKPSRKKKTIANENPKQDDPKDDLVTNGESVDSPGELKVSTVPSESSKSLSSSMGSGDSAERTTAQDIDHLLKG